MGDIGGSPQFGLGRYPVCLPALVHPYHPLPSGQAAPQDGERTGRIGPAVPPHLSVPGHPHAPDHEGPPRRLDRQSGGRRTDTESESSETSFYCDDPWCSGERLPRLAEKESGPCLSSPQCSRSPPLAIPLLHPQHP